MDQPSLDFDSHSDESTAPPVQLNQESQGLLVALMAELIIDAYQHKERISNDQCKA
jgi:hypothetical protein